MGASALTLPLASATASATAGGAAWAAPAPRPGPLLKVESIDQYYGGSHILRKLSL